MSRPTVIPRRARWAAILCCLGLLCAFAGAQSQAPTPQKSSAPSVGKSMPHGQLYQLELANGQRSTVFPHDPWAPFDHLTWHYPLAYTVTNVKYEPGQRELLVELDFTVGKESEKRLLDKLVLGYRKAGAPTVEFDAISLVGLEPVAWSVAVEHENRRFELYHSGSGAKSLPTRRVVSFNVPMAPEYDRLHRKLSDDAQKSVNVIVSGQYEFAKVAGGSIENRILASAWEAVREKMVGPSGEKPGHDLLVSREGMAEVKKLLRQTVGERVILMCPKEDREWVMAHLEKKLDKVMERLTQPVDLLKLHELGEGALVWTPSKIGVIEASPALINKEITKSKEWAKEEATLVTKAKNLSQSANLYKNREKEFHQEARKMSLACEVSVGIKLFSGNAKMNLSTAFDQLKEKEKEEVKSAQSFMQSESEYLSNVKKEHYLELEGRNEFKTAVAKTLSINRISSSALLAESLGMGQVTWENGVETVAIELPLPLVATQQEKDNDTVAGLREEQRTLKKKLEELDGKWKDLAKQQAQNNIRVTYVDVPLTVAAERPKDLHGYWVPITPLDGKTKAPFEKTFGPYGEEVLGAFMFPIANFETNPFWVYAAGPANKNQVRIEAHGLRPGGHTFRVYIIYRGGK